MFVVFFDVKDDGSCQLNLGQQVEISQNKENFALSLKLRDHVLLIGEQVVVLILVSLVSVRVDITVRLEEVVFPVLFISEREHIIATLDHKKGEVEISQLEIDVTDLTRRLNLGGPSLIVPVELLA